MATPATRRAVLGGYKRLLVAARRAFAGDAVATEASVVQLRAEFRKNAAVTDAATIGTLVRGIGEAEEFLLHHVVQGKLNERGNYEISLSEEHGEGGAGDIEVEVAMAGDEHQDIPVKPAGGCASGGGEEAPAQETPR